MSKSYKRILVQLVGEKLDIEDLEFCLTKNNSWRIIDDKDDKYLTSEEFKGIPNEDIRTIVDEFLKYINGAVSILYLDHKYVSSGSIISINEDGTRSVYLRVQTLIIRSRFRGILTISGQDNDMESDVEKWLRISSIDSAVKDVLYYFNEPSWYNLYKIHEIIRRDLGGKKKLEKFINKKALDNFTHTAQCKKAIGYLARHDDNKPSPKIPMNIKNARLFIKEIFKKWITQKG